MAIEVVDLPPGVANLFNQAFATNLQRQEAGASAYAEATRWDYLSNHGKIDFAQAAGVRTVDESGSGRARMQDVGLAQPISGGGPYVGPGSVGPGGTVAGASQK